MAINRDENSVIPELKTDSGVILEQFIADSGSIRKDSPYLPDLFKGWIIRYKRDLLGRKMSHDEWGKVYVEFSKQEVK